MSQEVGPSACKKRSNPTDVSEEGSAAPSPTLLFRLSF